MGTFIFRLCIDNTLCLVTAFDKIEADTCWRKTKASSQRPSIILLG